jgi:glycosyltransferase involved in cell wall biosynthesis
MPTAPIRVILNANAAAGARTGVGHYTAELIDRLQRDPGLSLTLCPPKVLYNLREKWDRPKPAALGTAPAMARATRGSLKRRIKQSVTGQLRSGYNGLMSLYARWNFRPGKYDLYHEPNFFPLPSTIPVVLTVHDLSVVTHPEWHPADRVRFYEKHFFPKLGQVAQFLTVSEAARDEIIRVLNVAPQRVTRTYNGIRNHLRPLPREEIAPVLARLGLPPQYLLHVGTVEPRKNLPMLMKAYCALPDDVRARCPLVLAGKWGWRVEEAIEYYETTARHRHVVQLGYVADDDLAALYNGARALVFPTFYEGFGMPAAEMLACGGAVLASTNAAVAEVVADVGTTIDPHDESAWHRAMARIITDDDWQRMLCRGSIERAGRFTWEDCAADTAIAYRKALS